MKIEIDTEELTMMANSLMGRMGRDEEGWRDRLRIEAQARSAAEERLRDVQEELSGLRNFPLQARFDRCKEQLSLASKRADEAEAKANFTNENALVAADGWRDEIRQHVQSIEQLRQILADRDHTIAQLRSELEEARGKITGLIKDRDAIAADRDRLIDENTARDMETQHGECRTFEDIMKIIDDHESRENP